MFNYAHMLSLFAAQRKFKDADLPKTLRKNWHCCMGYQFIGMDHFTRPDDELALAQRAGRLHCNFQGYTTQDECDLLGGSIGDKYDRRPLCAKSESHAQLS